MTQDFESWYAREHGRLVNSLYVVSGSQDAAAEATDEAFTRAAVRWRRVSKMESPTAWTYQVGLNVIRRMMRKHRREQDAARRAVGPHTLFVDPPHPEVWAAVRTLPERQRSAIVLRYVADLAEDDIATVLNVPRGTVASDLSRGRKALAALLADPNPIVLEATHDRH